MKTRIFSVLCQNIPGVMMRISRDFTRRQINLDSITVGIEPTGLARIILIFKADDHMAEFMRRVLARSEPIVDVEVIEPERSIVREVALLKTRKLDDKKMWEAVQQIERAGGRVLESKGGVLVAELSGEHDEIERVVTVLGPEVLKEVARSGQVLISRETT
ncbi:MAG: acetolactate synthase small subunit [Candidatus Hodarchaeaceae archaeon]|nr:acetolactate synthase small subunit [Candidatus Hodarchaeaceae archaeon]